MDDKVCCPYCRSKSVKTTGMACFVECGECVEETKSYEEEAEIEEYYCNKCMRAFFLRSDGM